VDTLRYAVIGHGNMGSAHAGQIFDGNVPGAVLTAICDIDEKKLAAAKEKYGDKIEYFKTADELFKSKKCDAVVIATPHYAHTELAIDAMKEGICVLCEKPAGVRVSDVKKMNLVARVSGVKFGLMFNQRMNPVFGALKMYVDMGVLGQIKHFTWIINNWYRTQTYYNSAGWRATWKGEGGGVLLNQAPHNLDLWQWIMGMPESMRAFCHEGKYHNIAVEDDVTIYAEYANGATATFITSTGEYPGTNRLEISGSMGKAVCEDGKIKLSLLTEDERFICFNSEEAMPKEKVISVEIEPKPLEEEHLMVLKNFTNHCLFGEELVAPGEEGIKSLMISNAAYVSSWKGKTVKVPVKESTFNRLLSGKKDISRDADSSKNPAAPTSNYSERWSVRW